MTASIQPIHLAPAPPAAPVLERPFVAAAAAGAPAPATGPAVELELSALARALEKLAQLPELDPRAMAQLLGLVREQGELLRLLGTLAGAAGPARAEAMQKLAALVETPKGPGASVREPGAGESAPKPQEPAAPNLVQDLQARIALSAARLVAAVKGALGPLLEAATATGADAAAFSKLQSPASGPRPAASRLLTQFAAVFRQLAGLAPTGFARAGAVRGTMNVASGGSDLQTVVADELRQLQTTGKLADAPLLRKDFIQSTLNVVATLLSESAVAESARPSATPAQPPPGSPSSPPATPAGAPTPQTPSVSSLSLNERAAALLKIMADLKPLMTAAGLETWARVEPELGVLARPALSAGAPASDPKAAARAGDLARRGLFFEIQVLDGPRLKAAVAELKQRGIAAEVIRTGHSRIVTLRVSLPDKSSGAPPSGGMDKRSGVPPLGGIESPDSAPGSSASPATADSRPETPREAFTPLLFAALAQAREAPFAALTDDSSGRARLDQYTHPESQRFSPQTQQDAAMIQMTAFYQSRREQAVRGDRFEPRTGEQAVPVRLMLEYKPILVLRPGQGVAFGGEPGATAPIESESPSPVIDVQPLEVRRQ